MVSTKRVQPEQFETTEWHTAERKSRFVNTLLRFIKDDCPREKFIKQLYDGLYNDGHFGFIAHYDIHGFYDEQLSTPERRSLFIAELRRGCEQHSHLDRPDLWSDVKAVLAERLSPREPRTATRARTATSARRAAPKYDGPTLF
ncbi:hypothetical protein [Leucobacter triazinivorans]|uniref:Uncharacterized protein n=1 Tax=Leucobacter triazinivorans TaxID=1784719 RepID=A0A4P6KE79_9MICO|nr:hypothetical protein [Leucobacter triazinivorans]QBE48251.1 hypothetical protein EVS81_04890 [Leucobacter triazinivorans]